MSRIDELVHELCPDGVEHAGVLDIADYVRGITYSKNDEDLVGEIQVLRANNITLASHTLNFEDVKRVSSHVRVRDAQRLRAGDTLICAGSGSRDHIGKVAYIREDIDPTFGGFMAVLRTTDVRVESRFLFHLLTGERFKAHLDRSLSTSTINNLNASVMRGFRVPVPPLEVQREIVRVLDTFTQLEAELEAELEARRSQYEHYLSHLFEGLPEGTPLKTFSDVGVFSRGGGPQKKDFIDSGVGCIHYGQIYTHYGVSATVTNKFVSAAAAARAKGAYPGDVVIAVTSENDDDLARSVAWLGSDWVAVSNHTLIFTSEMDPRFVSYYLRSRQFDGSSRFVVNDPAVAGIHATVLAALVSRIRVR